MNDDKEKSLEVYYGSVIFFKGALGFGFLSWKKDGVDQKDMFVHFSDIEMNGYKNLKKDQKVQFTIGKNKNGDPKATNVKVLIN